MSVDGVELIAKYKRTAAAKSRSDELKAILAFNRSKVSL
jgi:hypothetical protein